MSELEKSYPQVYDWLKDLLHYKDEKLEDYFTITYSDRTTLVEVKFYTDNYKYTLQITDSGYLGAGVSNRKPLPGETWTRGRDLSDGKLNHETW